MILRDSRMALSNEVLSAVCETGTRGIQRWGRDRPLLLLPRPLYIISPSLHLSFDPSRLSVLLSLHLPICPSIHQSVLPVHPSLHPDHPPVSIYLSVHPFISLSSLSIPPSILTILLSLHPCVSIVMDVPYCWLSVVIIK